ncbi:hypothetical protein O6H91_19G041700 [Diphasiastrum complanatum]|uniref:Uncharacterized protein n=1 Tax=Diphasiastrum complanatum TaxID=34168 RepID=A0ACC2AUH6_DIPCM|nr:hypothetical protein O6H91_19G041700 [Diphasiastrum complanatum]
MASKRGASGRGKFAEEAPWRAFSGEKAVPRISQGFSGITLSNGPHLQYAATIIKHPDPIGMGLAAEAFIEAAGPDCIIPGLVRPFSLLGVQVWPLSIPTINLKALEPIGRELRTISQLMEKAFDVMQAPFGGR